jgi:hypothetical protein
LAGAGFPDHSCQVQLLPAREDRQASATFTSTAARIENDRRDNKTLEALPLNTK